MGKAELVIENIDNLNHGANLVVKRKGDKFKIGISPKPTGVSKTRSRQDAASTVTGNQARVSINSS